MSTAGSASRGRRPPSCRLDVGAAKARKYRCAIDGDRSAGHHGDRNLNAITPETDGTTHYFWAQARDFRVDEDWISDLFVQSTHEAFSEDLWIIGLQQENMDTGTTHPRIDINHDGAAIQAIRMLEAMIEAENDPGAGQTAQAAE